MLYSRSLLVICSIFQSCPNLCDPIHCSPPGFSVHGIFQARKTGMGCISFTKGSSQPRNQTHVSCVSCIAGGFFTAEPSGKLVLSLNMCSQLWKRSNIVDTIRWQYDTKLLFPLKVSLQCSSHTHLHCIDSKFFN